MEIEECITKLLQSVEPLTGDEKVRLECALERITAKDIYAPINVPDFTKSAMDGYAVRAQEVADASPEHPVALPVVGKIFAGDVGNDAYPAYCCVQIMTGAMVPAGFDAVVKQENTDYGKQVCRIYKTVKPHENCCLRGEDVERGELLIAAGTQLHPLHLGILASCGLVQVAVKPKLKVALLATGSELLEPGDPLASGKIYNNISYVLKAALRRQGMQVVICASCADEHLLLEQKISELLEHCDVLITTGGISVGEKDLVPRALGALGAQDIFSHAAIQPGTPTRASLLQGKVILSLSGNPYAAYANFELYFWELAAKLLGCAQLKVKQEQGILTSAITKHIKQRRLLRAYIADGQVTVPDSSHAASVMRNLVACNSFVDVRPGQDVRAGAVVRVRYFKG